MSPEEQSLIRAIENMFAYLGTGASSDAAAVFCRDFRAFENGIQMSGAEFLNLMRKLYIEGRRYRWSVNDPHVELQGSLAVVVHVNKGEIVEGPGSVPVPASWLETIVLRHEQLGWRIAFIHATRTKEMTPAAA